METVRNKPLWIQQFNDKWELIVDSKSIEDRLFWVVDSETELFYLDIWLETERLEKIDYRSVSLWIDISKMFEYTLNSWKYYLTRIYYVDNIIPD